VQLALLTKAQWRAAAGIPRSVGESRKLILSDLADYRRETKEVISGFDSAFKGQISELRIVMETNARNIEQAAMHINAQFDGAETAAIKVKHSMENAALEWKSIKESAMGQCQQLEQVSQNLQNRFAWQEMLLGLVWYSMACGLGLLIGHYCWRR
jgi:hypothetical protein